jgi:membrane protein DedA with SNARE-associated domain
MVAFLQSSKYFLLFAAALFEGPVASLTSGLLLRFGMVDFVPIYLVLVAGDLTADIGWYCLGRYGTRALLIRRGAIFNITPDSLATIERRFNRYHKKILFISKLTMGMGFAIVTLTVAGMSRVPFKNFVALNLGGGLIWTLFLLTVGYYFGNVFALFSDTQKIVLLAAVAAAFALSLRLANRYLMTKDL